MKSVVLNDGHEAVIKCPSCGAVTTLRYETKAKYLEELKSPCRRCQKP